VNKPGSETTLAQIQARFGDHDAAIDALPHLLEVPAGLTIANLKLDPFWDPLRKDPRFQSCYNRRSGTRKPRRDERIRATPEATQVGAMGGGVCRGCLRAHPSLDIVAQRFSWPDSIERTLIIAACIGFFMPWCLPGIMANGARNALLARSC